VPDILHQFPIAAPASRVYEAVTTPSGLDRWWTARSSGTPRTGTTYQLWFGPEYDWRARVTECLPDRAFELELTTAMPDWVGTRVRFLLEASENGTMLNFAHTGWVEASEHFRISSFCWAMYLRILKRNLEHGETVPYDQRLSV
jgi:uncharacterized protein YndB with AHSA1/START domain